MQRVEGLENIGIVYSVKSAVSSILFSTSIFFLYALKTLYFYALFVYAHKVAKLGK